MNAKDKAQMLLAQKVTHLTSHPAHEDVPLAQKGVKRFSMYKDNAVVNEFKDTYMSYGP